jgi:hypothetical protein
MKEQYMLFLILYMCILIILYLYKIQIEGFNDITDFIYSNLALSIGFGSIIIILIVYILYKIFKG